MPSDCTGTLEKQFLNHLMSSSGNASYLICKFPSLTHCLFHLLGLLSYLGHLTQPIMSKWNSTHLLFHVTNILKFTSLCKGLEPLKRKGWVKLSWLWRGLVWHIKLQGLAFRLFCARPQYFCMPAFLDFIFNFLMLFHHLEFFLFT